MWIIASVVRRTRLRESPNTEKSNEMEVSREKKKDIKERQWRRSAQVSGAPPGAKGTNGSEAMFADSQRLPTYPPRGQADGERSRGLPGFV